MHWTLDDVAPPGPPAGEVTLPLQTRYAELSAVEEQLRPGTSDTGPAVLPLLSPFMANYEVNAGRKELVFTGITTYRDLPPFGHDAASVHWQIIAPYRPWDFCKELCLHIKVAPNEDSDVPVISSDKVARIIRKANAIWGCSKKAQCCIRLRIEQTVIAVDPKLPFTVRTDRQKQTDDVKKVLDTDRSEHCYNLYFIDELVVPSGQEKMKGQTWSTEPTGSIVQVDRMSEDDLVDLTAHELGHALGLGLNPGEESDGVTKHSSKPDNVMQPSLPEPGKRYDKLNAKQCAEAQKSLLLELTFAKCFAKPREKKWL
jgi:hypothetical protein